jgi:hypothetical protein
VPCGSVAGETTSPLGHQTDPRSSHIPSFYQSHPLASATWLLSANSFGLAAPTHRSRTSAACHDSPHLRGSPAPRSPTVASPPPRAPPMTPAYRRLPPSPASRPRQQPRPSGRGGVCPRRLPRPVVNREWSELPLETLKRELTDLGRLGGDRAFSRDCGEMMKGKKLLIVGQKMRFVLRAFIHRTTGSGVYSSALCSTKSRQRHPPHRPSPPPGGRNPPTPPRATLLCYYYYRSQRFGPTNFSANGFAARIHPSSPSNSRPVSTPFLTSRY